MQIVNLLHALYYYDTVRTVIDHHRYTENTFLQCMGLEEILKNVFRSATHAQLYLHPDLQMNSILLSPVRKVLKYLITFIYIHLSIRYIIHDVNT